jgi:hypothetical protein
MVAAVDEALSLMDGYERFFCRVRQDIFRPFTGRHRGYAIA